MAWRLAWRSIWRHRRGTVITVFSIGLGLTVVVFFVSLAEGMYHQLVTDAVRMQAGHVTLEHAAYRDAPAVDLRLRDATALRAAVDAIPGVERTKLLVLGQGVAGSGTGSAGVAVMGVEPTNEAATSPLARRLTAGTWLRDDDDGRAVVGADLAERLNLTEDRKLVLTTNDAQGNLVETLLRVRGVFRTGAEEIDGYVVLVPLAGARRIFGLGPDDATQLGVVLSDPDHAPAVRAAIRAAAPDPAVAIRPWPEVLPDLAAFIRLDRTSDRTFQGLLLFLICFTVFNTLLMSVMERTREFAVQLALGTAPAQLCRQILLEATYVGALGCAVGIGIGAAVSGWVQVYGWDLSWLYPEGLTISGLAVSTVVHARVTVRILAGLAAIVFGATLLASLVPMRRAARIDVAEVLR